MVSAGLRTYIRNCVGVVSIGIDLSPPCTRARSLMPRNFGFPKPVDPLDQWPGVANQATSRHLHDNAARLYGRTK